MLALRLAAFAAATARCTQTAASTARVLWRATLLIARNRTNSTKKGAVEQQVEQLWSGKPWRRGLLPDCH